MDCYTARNLLNLTALKMAAKKQWPLNVESVANEFGIALRIRTGNDDRIKAHIELASRSEIVLERPNFAPQALLPRERFSIAHEIGHWILWHSMQSVPRSDREYWEHEQLCDEFASKLLISRQRLAKGIVKLGLAGYRPLAFPDIVARRADVSWEAAAHAISQIDASPHAFMRFVTIAEQVDKQPNGSHLPVERIQLQCHTLSGSVRAAGNRTVINDKRVVNQLKAVPVNEVCVNLLTGRFGRLSVSSMPCTISRRGTQWMLHLDRTSGSYSVSECKK